ncbi:unnamed protein product [Prunus armeniaca]
MIHIYDNLLAKFEAYHEAAEKSKFEVVVDAYKLGRFWKLTCVSLMMLLGQWHASSLERFGTCLASPLGRFLVDDMRLP